MQLTILGASGFVGRSLSKVALARGLSVRAIGRGPCADAMAGAMWVQVENYADTPKPRGPDDVLIHLAQPSALNEQQDMQEGVRLVDRLLALGYSKTCYASSAVVYGDRHRYPHGVGDTVGEAAHYAALKLVCEKHFVAEGGLVVRLTNLYGSGQPQSSVLWRILSQIPGSAPLRVRTVTPVRDFCWVDDAADAIIELCEANVCGIFNVGSGRGISIGELARLCLEAAGESERQIMAEVADHGAQSVLLVDISQTVAACGWRPRTNLRAGLKQLVGVRA